MTMTAVPFVAEPDEGRVDLPRPGGYAEPASTLPFTEGRRCPMAKREERLICIVDDDASLRRSLANLLMSVGFRVTTFESAEAFLTAAERHRIGCIVLDVRMAGMSGLELLRHLAGSGTRMPAVMLTAHGDDETRRRALEAGAVAFLEKPVRTEALLDAVRTALSSG